MTTEQLPAPQPAPPVRERRVAVLPFAIAGAVLVAAIAAAVGLASLASAPAPQPPPVAAIPPAPSPDPEGEPASQPEEEPAPLPPAGPGQCLDHAGDAVVDLVAVQLEPGRRGAVVAAFELAGPLPAGEASISLLAEGQRDSYRFTGEWRDGELESFWVLEVDDDDRDRLDRRSITVQGSTVVMELPAKLVKRLGEHWSWSAFTGADGLLDDACGDGLVPYVGDRDDD